MYIFSYGEPSILHGYYSNEILMAGKRKCSDCDDCDKDYWICAFDGNDDCERVTFCGYDAGLHDDSDMVCTCDYIEWWLSLFVKLGTKSPWVLNLTTGTKISAVTKNK